MSYTLIALLGFAFWTLALLFLIINLRGIAVLFQGKAVNGFTSDGSGESAFSQRLCRAHANCYENLGMAAAVLLTAIATEQTVITEPLALAFLAARIAQSTVHLVSIAPWAVWLRVSFQLMQIAILACWIIQLALALI